MGLVKIIEGDCREVMAGMLENSIDAIVTDPPYGLEFMGKDWDRLAMVGHAGGLVNGKPGAKSRGIAGNFRRDDLGQKMRETQDWHYRWAVEAFRVLKPGGHLLAFGGTRTYHRLTCALEDAGFEIRDCLMWVYGSGFPKSLDVSKAIDKAAGAERERVAGPKSGGMAALNKGNAAHGYRDAAYYDDGNMMLSSEPVTDAARRWSGWGTALKPAWEPIIVARKPLDGTVAENVLKWGTGGLNIDGCRVPGEPVPINKLEVWSGFGQMVKPDYTPTVNTQGRWPANLIHDGSEEVVGLFPSNCPGMASQVDTKETPSNYFGLTKHPGIRNGRGDTGSAARFFYCAKASKADRDEGCEGMEAIHRANGNKWTDQDYRVANGERPPSAESGPRRNHHPTVKPTALMRHLCRLVTPPGGLVLDPFCGSGSTGKAALLEGFRFVGIELDAEYCAIARARIEAAREAVNGKGKSVRKKVRNDKKEVEYVADDLFSVVGEGLDNDLGVVHGSEVVEGVCGAEEDA